MFEYYKTNVAIMKRRIINTCSHTGYCIGIHAIGHCTIPVQGFGNDDQSLSPVTPLAFFTFSVVPNPLKCSETFFIYVMNK